MIKQIIREKKKLLKITMRKFVYFQKEKKVKTDLCHIFSMGYTTDFRETLLQNRLLKLPLNIKKDALMLRRASPACYKKP